MQSPLAAQNEIQVSAVVSNRDSQINHAKRQHQWFYTGRIVAGKNAAQLRKRANDVKLKMPGQRAAIAASATAEATAPSSIPWTPLDSVGLASDASGNGTQDYHQVAGRATAVAIESRGPCGNTVYVGGAQAGVLKSTNPANGTANNVTWVPLTDNQATLSIGALAIQPGNGVPANSLVLAATGEKGRQFRRFIFRPGFPAFHKRWQFLESHYNRQ